MATSLGKVGIVNKGEYSTESTYNAGDFVLYKGSTWLSLKDGLLGVEPVEGTSWKYLARGFEAEVLSLITANDTSGLMGDAGQKVNAQSLLDVLADKVANRLLDKGMIVDNFTSDRSDLPGSAANDKRLHNMISDVNKNINGTFYETSDLIEWANSKHETMSASFATTCTSLPDSGNFDVLRIEHGGYLASMIAIRQSDRRMFISEYNTVTWSSWTEYVTSNDLTIKSNSNFLRVGNVVEFHIVNDWLNKRSIPQGYRPCGLRHFQMFDITLNTVVDVYFDNSTNTFVSDDHNFYGTLTWFTVDAMPS